MRKVLLTILLVLVLLPLEARRRPRYPFVRTDLSYLQMPGGKAPEFYHFCRKLDTLLLTGGGDVRILQVGGSHVQGGTFSDRLRRNFLSLRYGMAGGRGLVFPFSAAHTNTPVSYNSSYMGNWESVNCLRPGGEPLGLTGMAVTARDTSARVVVDLALREKQFLQQRYTFNKVDVLGMEVPHTHIHLVPLNSEGDLDFRKEHLKPSPERFAAVAEAIRSEFEKL